MTDFAFYRFSSRVISRSRNQNVVARAAYQSGTEVKCMDSGGSFGEHRYNFTYKKDVQMAFIAAPEHSPEWVYDREKLWNAVLGRETRRDARLARDLMLSIPRELGEEEREHLVRDFVQHTLVDKYGLICDVAIHDSGDDNPHAHILMPLRRYNADGWGQRDKDLVNKGILYKLREGWAGACNERFSKSGLDLFVSSKPRSAWSRELEIQRTLTLERSISL